MGCRHWQPCCIVAQAGLPVLRLGANRAGDEIDGVVVELAHIQDGVFGDSAIAASALGAARRAQRLQARMWVSTSETLTQGYVIDQQQIDQVPVGSSREQVLLALGSAVDHGDVRQRGVLLHLADPRPARRLHEPEAGRPARACRLFRRGRPRRPTSPITASRTASCSTSSRARRRPAARTSNFLSQLLAGAGKSRATCWAAATAAMGRRRWSYLPRRAAAADSQTKGPPDRSRGLLLVRRRPLIRRRAPAPRAAAAPRCW